MDRPYAKYVRAASAMLAGLAIGFLATVLSLDSGYGFNWLAAGPWVAWPQLGGLEIDPYARAVVARSGEAPLGRDQGLAFFAHSDSGGAPLDGGCEYRIVDPLPTARFWSIGLVSPQGAPLANPTERYGYTSADIFRREGGSFEVAIAREARPGNWLSPGDAREFVIVLRLYDTPLDVDARQNASSFPTIEKIRCT